MITNHYFELDFTTTKHKWNMQKHNQDKIYIFYNFYREWYSTSLETTRDQTISLESLQDMNHLPWIAIRNENYTSLEIP